MHFGASIQRLASTLERPEKESTLRRFGLDTAILNASRIRKGLRIR